ncbi:hypothetical protein AAG906_039150 [Vitis piasezkii]
METISGYIRNSYMDEAMSLFHVMSLEVVMFGTDFPMFATPHFRLIKCHLMLKSKFLRPGKAIVEEAEIHASTVAKKSPAERLLNPTAKANRSSNDEWPLVEQSPAANVSFLLELSTDPKPFIDQSHLPLDSSHRINPQLDEAQVEDDSGDENLNEGHVTSASMPVERYRKATRETSHTIHFIHENQHSSHPLQPRHHHPSPRSLPESGSQIGVASSGTHSAQPENPSPIGLYHRLSFLKPVPTRAHSRGVVAVDTAGDEQVSFSREEFGSKAIEVSDLQGNENELNLLNLQQKNEILVLKESLRKAEEALVAAHSELQEKRETLKQSLAEMSNELERCSQELQSKDARLHEVEIN